jgi:hypothetical protein
MCPGGGGANQNFLDFSGGLTSYLMNLHFQVNEKLGKFKGGFFWGGGGAALVHCMYMMYALH